MGALLADPHNTPSARFAGAREGGPLVLIVEDHEDTRVMLKVALESRGYRVAEAADGEEGVRLARRARPRLVIMDATLPRLDGLAATRRIRLDSALEGVAVVFLSGHAQPDFRAAALDAGGDDFLVKPVALEELMSVLERRLRASQSRIANPTL
jgi:two-component system phosphate regulon response regulator PhoB